MAYGRNLQCAHPSEITGSNNRSMLGGVFMQIFVRQIKYLNNIVEQDHRFVKKITKPMKGFKSFEAAEATLSGIELHHMLRKQQHDQSDNQTIFEQFNGLAA